jgi:hypothetical protein
MSRSLRGSWGRKDIPVDQKALRDGAETAVKERDETAFKRLQDLQAKEIKALETEHAWLGDMQARDPKPANEKEIASLNQRFDRQQRELKRRHDGFLGKLSRVFGGHQRQKAQVQRIERQRAKEVGEREALQALREGQRQKSLGQHMSRVSRDIQEAKERHVVARQEFRTQRERGFEMAVRNEMTRQRSRGRGRSM